MKAKNKYVNRSHISEKKFREIIKYFSLDLNVVCLCLWAQITELSRQAINKYLTAIRLEIFREELLKLSLYFKI